MSERVDDTMRGDSADLETVRRGYNRPNDPYVEVPTGPVRPWASCDQQQEIPDPVRRTPSLRYRRNVISLCVLAFTIGSLLLVLSSPWKNEFLAPGPLHSSHAQLLADHGADRCAACHDASTSSLSGWAAHAFSGTENRLKQADLCLECHRESMNGQFALEPHNVSPKELAEKSSRIQSVSWVKRLAPAATDSNGQIACTACHREHKGNQDLKAMTDQQCQSCHKESYHRFESDHPEFSNWPSASRQRIAFDHGSHFGRHFPAKETDFNCAVCHVDDQYQNVKVLAGFEQACASCHEQQIVDSGQRGFALLALPSLDMKAIEKQGLSVKSWPLAASRDFDGTIPPAMRLLLMADKEAREVLIKRGENFEYSDLDADQADDVRDAVTLAWATKRLIFELANSDATAAQFRQRLEFVLQTPLTGDEFSGLTEGLDAQAFQMTAWRWLPHLKSEIEDAQANAAIDAHQDMVLARVVSQDLLAENPLADASSKNDVATPVVEPQKQNPGKHPTRARMAHSTTVGEVPIFPARPQGSFGTGWIRDDVSLRIMYRPQSHQDPLLASWSDVLLKMPHVDSDPATRGLFKELTGEYSLGNCRSCHTVARQSDDSFVMNWKASLRDASVGNFTKFSHRPHLLQSQLKDCSGCHQLDQTVSNAASFASFDQCDYKSNFRAIEKSNCASCHRSGLTSNNCTTCHSYHVGGHTKP